MKILILFIYFISLILFTFYKNVRDIHNFQQNSYTASTYLRWIRDSKVKVKTDYNRVLIVSFLFLLIGSISINSVLQIIFLAISFLFLYISYFMFKFRKNSAVVKKKLVFTSRVKRLMTSIFILNFIFYFIVFYLFNIRDLKIFLGLIFIQIIFNLNSYAVVIKANILNIPVEKSVNRWYINDAQKILRKNKNIIVIGITGSYGKTSVKNILGAILNKKYSILMTPESYNTPMGVVKSIRSSLKAYDDIFIAEMGAYRRGEIKEICDIVHPNLSVITSIGEQHLDTFKTKDNIIKTKGEIFENTVKNGTVFVNLYDENIRNIKIREDLEVISFGKSNSEDKEGEDGNSYCYVEDFQVLGDGTTVSLSSEVYGKFKIKTKLLGRHNVENVVLCVSIAIKLGLTVEEINRGLLDIEPITHRLSYKRVNGGYTIIDDAFNSNPVGSRNALEVLKLMEGNKKIIMTPGMIGLGEREDEFNEKFGEYMVGTCDFVILVGDMQTRSIQKGLSNLDFPVEKIKIVTSTLEGFEFINKIIKTGDVLLIENDLPDIFNE